MVGVLSGGRGYFVRLASEPEDAFLGPSRLPSCQPPLVVSYSHRRRIYTEEKANVVAVSWGTELLQFFAAPGRVEELADLHPFIQLV